MIPGEQVYCKVQWVSSSAIIRRLWCFPADIAEERGPGEDQPGEKRKLTESAGEFQKAPTRQSPEGVHDQSNREEHVCDVAEIARQHDN